MKIVIHSEKSDDSKNSNKPMDQLVNMNVLRVASRRAWQ
jgi:hypothetical protein